jgi:hypothetical protein
MLAGILQCDELAAHLPLGVITTATQQAPGGYFRVHIDKFLFQQHLQVRSARSVQSIAKVAIRDDTMS